MDTKEIVPINIEDFAMTPELVVKQVGVIQQVMERVMKKDEHYGTIPGTAKPTLLKPGAEKLSHTFRFSTKYRITKTDLSGGHREYGIVCELTHMPTGTFVAEGVGCCSTMESRYRYRKAEAKCPECGKPAIIKGKKQYGGGWLCWQKKGGCGAKFKDGDPAIENMDMGKVEYSDPADYYNTVLKIAKKRAHVDAVLTATAASDIFTQDLEDLPPEILNPSKPEPKQQPENLAQFEGRDTSDPTDPFPNTDKPKGTNCTKKQYGFLVKLAKDRQMDKDALNSLVEWFRKGEKLSKDEASELIEIMQDQEKFGELCENYMMEKAE
jgi:hypothetical protein